jgi:hypothetical protein
MNPRGICQTGKEYNGERVSFQERVRYLIRMSADSAKVSLSYSFPETFLTHPNNGLSEIHILSLALNDDLMFSSYQIDR